MNITALATNLSNGAKPGEVLPCPYLGVPAPAHMPWAPFVNCLLAGTKGCIELRALNPDGTIADSPLHTRDLAAITQSCLKHNGVNHIYIGAATRIGGGGTKSHCQEAIWTWADIDFKDFPGGEEEARKRLADFPCPPNLVVATGGGLHCYWSLATTVHLQKDGGRLEDALRRIAHKLGADKSRTEWASLMRMPGQVQSIARWRNGVRTGAERLKGLRNGMKSAYNRPIRSGRYQRTHLDDRRDELR
jgi:hypothetical protein